MLNKNKTKKGVVEKTTYSKICRAYDIEHKKIYYSTDYIKISDFISDCDNNILDVKTLSFYINIKDVNNNPIFEGDILEDVHGHCVTVTFPSVFDYYTLLTVGFRVKLEHCKIIGDIYK